MGYQLLPGELNGSSSVVRLPREARPLGIGWIAIIRLGSDLFFEAETPSIGTIGCGRPATGSLMGYLSKKGGNLALTDDLAFSGSESAEGGGSFKERMVGVEVLGRAGRVVLVQEDGLKLLSADEGRYSTVAAVRC